MKQFAIIGVLALAACTSPTPISSNPIKDIATSPNNPLAPAGATIIQGLQDASFNFDNAVVVGALGKDDPAPGCAHGILQDLGADVVNSTTGSVPVATGGTVSNSFAPKVSDLISFGSVAYIRLQQAKAAAGGGITVPVSCEAIIGKVVIDGANKASGIGASLLTGGLLKLPAITGQ